MSAEVSYSIVICTYRRAAACANSVKALLRVAPPGGEILVIDQTVDAPADLRDMATGRIPIRHEHLTVPGVVKARNVGLALAKGDILIFLDDDVEPLEGLIEAHISAYEDPSVGAVAGRILRSFSDPGSGLDTRFNDPVDGWRFTSFDHLERVDLQTARGCNMSFRRALLLAIGGMDERLRPPFSFREDSDACFGIRGLGYVLRFEPRACLVHLEVPAGGTRDVAQAGGLLARELRLYRRHYQHAENHLYFLAKHFDGAAFRHHLWWSYRDYVGVSRWPWRLLAKNGGFVLALVNALRLRSRARTTHRPHHTAATGGRP